MDKRAAPAPVGRPVSPPPAVRGPTQRTPKALGNTVDERDEVEQAMGMPPFTDEDVVLLARHLSKNRGDNPDAYRYGQRRYEEQMELARAFLCAFVWWEDRKAEANDA